jgi:hypothetical protein
MASTLAHHTASQSKTRAGKTTAMRRQAGKPSMLGRQG